MDQKKTMLSPADNLRALLAGPEMVVISACYDALTARLVEQACMPATFMSGFGVAATRLGLPDTGLISYGELVEQGRTICSAVNIPVLGDGDTGFGNPLEGLMDFNSLQQIVGFQAYDEELDRYR